MEPVSTPPVHEDAIPVVVYSDTPAPAVRGILNPPLLGRREVVKVDPTVLRDSLARFIGNLDALFESLPATRRAKLKEVSVTVELTVGGGVQLVASANAQLSNSITLLFRMEE